MGVELASRLLYQGSDFLVRGDTDFGSSTCVVCFDSYTDDRTLERPGFGEGFFQEAGIDSIHFINRNNDWYQYDKLVEALDIVVAETARYTRVVTYGSSMGGYAALRFGGYLRADCGIAMSPQFSINPKVVPFENRWTRDAARLEFSVEERLSPHFVRKGYVFYDPYDPDRLHVDLFREHMEVVSVAIPWAGHPVTGYLAQTHLLSGSVLEIINETFDATKVSIQARQRRRSAAQRYQVLSRRARRLETRTILARKALELAPDNFFSLIDLSSLLAEQHQFAEAEDCLARATKVAPSHPLLLYRLSEIRERQGELSLAHSIMVELQHQHPEAHVYAPRAKYLVDKIRHSINPASVGSSEAPRLIQTLLDRVWPRGKRRTILKTISDAARRRPSVDRLDIAVTTSPAPPPFVHSWRRHAQLIERLPRKRLDLFLIGDSLAHYWPDPLWAPWTVFNFGVAADKTQHALWRLRQISAGRVEARHVLVMLGTNNLGADDSARGIAAGVLAVARAAEEIAPSAQIHVTAVPPCGENLSFRNDVRREANALLRISGLVNVIDLDTALLSAEGDAYHDDKIHFSEAGYKMLTDLVRPQMGK